MRVSANDKRKHAIVYNLYLAWTAHRERETPYYRVNLNITIFMCVYIGLAFRYEYMSTEWYNLIRKQNILLRLQHIFFLFSFIIVSVMTFYILFFRILRLTLFSLIKESKKTLWRNSCIAFLFRTYRAFVDKIDYVNFRQATLNKMFCPVYSISVSLNKYRSNFCRFILYNRFSYTSSWKHSFVSLQNFSHFVAT